MKDTINERILLLKTQLGLSNLEFCTKAKISNGTLHNIQIGENVSPKTIKTVCEALNVNKQWLLTGKGATYNEVKESEENNPWRDALVSQVKEENTRLQKELERVWQMVQHLTGGAKPNFLNAPEKASCAELLALVSGVKLSVAA